MIVFHFQFGFVANFLRNNLHMTDFDVEYLLKDILSNLGTIGKSWFDSIRNFIRIFVGRRWVFES